MKRGKDDGKIPEPLFPRLHINDTDKGGPRAPPRNKMALYEQFSIPSQRFNSGSNLVNRPGSSQVNGEERNIPFPVHLSSTRSTHKSENYYYPHADEADSNGSAAHPQQRRKTGDEDDFAVPVFVQPGLDKDTSRNQNNVERGNLTPNCTVDPMQPNNSRGENPKNTRSSALCLRQEAGAGSAAASREVSSSRQWFRKFRINVSDTDGMHRSPRQTDSSTHQDPDNSGASMSHRSTPNACLQQKHRGRQQREGSIGQNIDEHRKSLDDVTSSRIRSNSNSGEVDNDCDYQQEEAPKSQQIADANRSDDASDTSMVDSVSGMEITPDDIVGIIGQKHFWKARREIANQQRVFAVQVFELHRLVKVQKLIAESPNAMFEDASLFDLPPPKTSSAKRLASECGVKPSANIRNRKDNSEKPNHRMECTAENAVRTSQSPAKNGTQGSSNYITQADQPSMPIGADPKMAPWGLHQPYGQQWLIPVMSPSEGLIYKPYPGPGFVGSNAGGPGGSLPVGSIPFSCGYMNPAYGYPPSYPYPGALASQNFFLTSSMPAASVSGNEQMNSSSPANLRGPNSQLSGSRVNNNVQPQNFVSLPTQQSGAILEVTHLQISKESERQGSVGSSPRERRVNENLPAAAEVDALSLFPVASADVRGTQLGRVIKVVPHNRRSATESAARIFQSIRRERSQL